MSRWFRHYAGMMRDEKLVRAALQAKQPVERVVWVWGAILESAAEIQDHGRFDLDAAEAAYFLRTDEGDIRSILDALTALQRLAADRVVNWGARQFDSDRSAPRQAAYRERQRLQNSHGDDRQKEGDGGVTAKSRHGDAPETELELDTKTERKKALSGGRSRDAPPSDSAFDQFWKVYPKRDGANPKAPARKRFDAASKSGVPPEIIISGALNYSAEAKGKNQIGTPYIAQAMTWLGQRRWEDYAEKPSKDGGLSAAERDRLFAELRKKPNEIGDAEQTGTEPRTDLREARASPCPIEGRPGNGPPGDLSRNGRLEPLGAIFQAASGILPDRDEADTGWLGEGNDRTH